MKEEEKETKEGEKEAVFLPAELYGMVEERVHATEFQSVEEYVIFVLEEVLGIVILILLSYFITGSWVKASRKFISMLEVMRRGWD